MSTLSERLPADRRFEFASTACPADTFAVVRMNGFEAISRLYRFELVLVSDDAQLDLARVLAAKAELRILAPNGNAEPTPYAGMLAEFDQLHQAGGFTFYRAVLVPRLWQLSLYRSSEVYLHEQSIPEIVEAILQGARFSPSNDYTPRLIGSYRPRSYVCQYQETPLAFLSRWFEREGIYYHFEQADGVDRLVLLDDKVSQPAQAVAVSYRPADELDTGLAPDSIQAFVCRTRPLPRSVVLQDYNHRRAGMPLVVEVEVASGGVGEEMLYGENFRTEEEGRRYAEIRAQELRSGERVFSAESTAVGLRSGHFMELSHHYRGDFNGRYLVTEITHQGSQAGALLAGLKTPFNENEGHTSYSNSFVALPAAAQFRPARSTPKPRVAGTMNATIDAEGSGEHAELDEYGQYKVQIPFDRSDKGAGKGSAPVRMASPYSGSDHGMHFPLHKGAEVLLSFTDGDPDQPVILGAVPNSQNPNVVDQRNPQDNLISTKGGNQMLMSDTSGKEVIWLNSPFHKSSIGIGSVHPDGGGSIYEATSGGKDSVSFGHSNSMSFGPANSLSLGTKASIGAAFSNDVSMGTKISIDASTSMSWKANLGRLPGFEGLKNISIDDSKSIKFSLGGSGDKSSEGLKFEAGAFEHDASQLELDAAQNSLRAMIAGYTALNFTQSTIFGMAVNGSADGVFLAPGQKDAKKKQEADDLLFTDNEAKAKAAEKEELKKKTPPASVKAEAAQGATDAANWRKAEEQKIADKYKNGPYESTAEKAEREALKKRSPPADIDRRANAETVWRLSEEKKIDDKYKARAAEQAAPSNPARQSLQGWPGIIGKFGLDAVSNVAAMGLMQAYAAPLSQKIKSLNVVSEMKLDTEGITQSVNGEGSPDEAAWTVAKPNLVPLRSEVRLDPGSGIRLKVAAKKDDWSKDDALSEGAIEFIAKDIRLNSLVANTAVAPAGSFRTPLNGQKFAGMYFDATGDMAALRSEAGAKVEASGNTVALTADSVEVGFKADAFNFNLESMTALQKTAIKLEQEAIDKEEKARKELSRSNRILEVAPLQQKTELGTKAKLDREIHAAAKLALELASKTRAEADIKVAAALNGNLPKTSLVHGLTVTKNEANLLFGGSGLKASLSNLSLSFGNSVSKYEPIGVTVDGNLIKLG